MHISLPSQEKVIFDHDILGTAISRLPEGYEGPCNVAVAGKSETTLGFPSVAEAIAAAKFAVGELGGFFHATVSPGESTRITHQTWTDWAFS